MKKFIYIPQKDDKQKGMDKIHIHNGVQCASDKYRAGVILPNDKPDWDLYDACLDVVNFVEKETTKGSGKNKIKETIIVEEPNTLKLNSYFKSVTDNCESFQISKGDVKKLIKACKEKQAEYRKSLSALAPKEKKLCNYYGRIYIDIEEMKIITEDEAKELNHKFNKPNLVSFNIKYIRETLEFILCSGNSDIYFYYKSNSTPFVMMSGKLYALVMPMKIK